MLELIENSMQKFRQIIFLTVLFTTSVGAFGKDLCKVPNDSIGIENYVILSFEDYIGIIAEKDSLSPAELSEDDFKELKSITIEFLKNEDRIAETGIHEIKDIDKPGSYLFQFLPTVNARRHKLVWINGIHSSFLDKDQDFKKLIVIADGPNLNFWIDLSTKKIMR